MPAHEDRLADRRQHNTREYSMGELADKIDDSTRRLSDDIRRVEESVESLKNRVAYSDMQELKMSALEERLTTSVDTAKLASRKRPAKCSPTAFPVVKDITTEPELPPSVVQSCSMTVSSIRVSRPGARRFLS